MRPIRMLYSSAAIFLLATLSAAQAADKNSPNPQPAAADASAAFKRWDSNADSSLSPTEFGEGWKEVQMATALRNLHDNFVAKDLDKNGRLDSVEYANLNLIQQAGTSGPPLTRFDSDKNGALDFKEYVQLVGVLTNSNH